MRSGWQRGLVAGGMLMLDLLGAPATATESALRLVTLPPGNEVSVAAGESRRFSVTVTEKDAAIQWTVDGEAVGTDRKMEYRPESADIGQHTVNVTVLAGIHASRRSWRVTVTPPPLPKVRVATPKQVVVRIDVGKQARFRYRVASGVATDTVETEWSVDGEVVGKGPDLDLVAEEGPPRRVRAVATSALGSVLVREWQLVALAEDVPAADASDEDDELAVLAKSLRPEDRPSPPRRPSTTILLRAPTTTTIDETVQGASVTTTTIRTARPTTTIAPRTPPSTIVTAARREPPTDPRSPEPVTLGTIPSVMPPATQPPASRPRAPSPSPRREGLQRADVEAFLRRYARAYETESVTELRAIGQVTTAKQETGLTRYFAKVEDLDVELRVLEIEIDGDTSSVRFHRRDRFRDSKGRLVDQETPPIKKVIRQTPSGLVFIPRS